MEVVLFCFFFVFLFFIIMSNVRMYVTNVSSGQSHRQVTGHPLVCHVWQKIKNFPLFQAAILAMHYE